MSAAVKRDFGIPANLLDTVFPFHFAIDEHLHVLQVGSSLSRIAPQLTVGTALTASLVLRRPHGNLTISTISRAVEQPFLLELLDSGVRLRGQFLNLDGGRWLFLGSPWFDSAADIEAAGLSLGDYPVHDPMAELLMIGQTQRIALNDLHDLNERLQQQRAAVKRTERVYRDAIAAADAVAYHITADNERFEFIDSGILRLTGYDAGEMTPNFFRSLIIETRNVRMSHAATSEAGTFSDRCDHRILARDGSQRWLSEASIKVADSEGRSTGIVGILEDVTERREREAERERLSVELDTILKLSPQGFAAFDANGRLTYCNPSFEQMTGRRRRELEGRHMTALNTLFNKLSAGAQPLQSIADLPEDSADEITLAQPERRTLTRSLRPMGGSAQGLNGWVLFMRDVTREREIDRMKSEFLSIAAHELRTPMTSVRGFAELLLSNDYDQEMTREIAETIHRQSTLLVHIVNELLDIARIEAGQGADFDYERHAVYDLVKQTVATMRNPDECCEVIVDLPADESPVIWADGKKTMQVLANILSNAYKYSPDGGKITLSVLHREHSGRAEVGIRISDQGIGMDETELKRVFERFYRADPSGAIPGSGLGMSLVREIVELQDGSVEVSSTKGAGTTVTVFLPEITGTYVAAQQQGTA